MEYILDTKVKPSNQTVGVFTVSLFSLACLSCEVTVEVNERECFEFFEKAVLDKQTTFLSYQIDSYNPKDGLFHFVGATSVKAWPVNIGCKELFNLFYTKYMWEKVIVNATRNFGKPSTSVKFSCNFLYFRNSYSQ